jgi:hypothetical protein
VTEIVTAGLRSLCPRRSIINRLCNKICTVDIWLLFADNQRHWIVLSLPLGRYCQGWHITYENSPGPVDGIAFVSEHFFGFRISADTRRVKRCEGISWRSYIATRPTGLKRVWGASEHFYSKSNKIKGCKISAWNLSEFHFIVRAGVDMECF